jgi:hypothetical protein
MISVPVQVGVELGSSVAVEVGAEVEEAVAEAVICSSVGAGVSALGDGITQDAITSSPMMGATIHRFCLRTGLVFSGANLACTFSI